MSIHTLFDPGIFSPRRPHARKRRPAAPSARHATFARVYAATHDPAAAYRAGFGRLTRSGKLRTDAQAAAVGRRVLANPAVAAAVAREEGWRPLFDPATGRPTFCAVYEGPAAPRPPKARSRRHASRYRYVRYCKAGAYQARVPLGANKAEGRTKGDSVNLGLFTAADWGEAAEWAAGRAAKEFVRRNQPGRGLCEVIESLKADRLIPACVLPPRVFRRPDGGFGARSRRRGAVVAEVGPFATAGEAFAALAAAVSRPGTGSDRPYPCPQGIPCSDAERGRA